MDLSGFSLGFPAFVGAAHPDPLPISKHGLGAGWDLGSCCPWGNPPVSITAPGLPGALVASQVFRWRPQLGAAGAESASEGNVWVEAPRGAGRPRGPVWG